MIDYIPKDLQGYDLYEQITDVLEWVISGTITAQIAVRCIRVNADVVYTAVDGGGESNEITIQYIDPSAADRSAYVEVDNKRVSVYLATDSNYDITTTASEVLELVNSNDSASRLVTATLEGDGTGVVNATDERNLRGGWSNCHDQNIDYVNSIFDTQSYKYDYDYILRLFNANEYRDIFRTIDGRKLSMLIARIYNLKGTRKGLYLLLKLLGMDGTIYEWFTIEELVEAGDPDWTSGEGGVDYSSLKDDNPGCPIIIEMNVPSTLYIENLEAEIINLITRFLWVCVNLVEVRWKYPFSVSVPATQTFEEEEMDVDVWTWYNYYWHLSRDMGLPCRIKLLAPVYTKNLTYVNSSLTPPFLVCSPDHDDPIYTGVPQESFWYIGRDANADDTLIIGPSINQSCYWEINTESEFPIGSFVIGDGTVVNPRVIGETVRTMIDNLERSQLVATLIDGSPIIDSTWQQIGDGTIIGYGTTGEQELRWSERS